MNKTKRQLLRYFFVLRYFEYLSLAKSRYKQRDFSFYMFQNTLQSSRLISNQNALKLPKRI